MLVLCCGVLPSYWEWSVDSGIEIDTKQLMERQAMHIPEELRGYRLRIVTWRITGSWARAETRLPIWLFALLVAVMMASGVSMTQPCSASAKPGYTVYPASQYRSFHSQGTHGTDITVSADADGWVEIGAFQLRRSEVAEYFARGSVTPRRIKARFGSVGQIDMRWTPTSRPEVTSEPQGDCRGRKALVQQGVWVGSFSFRGENGYTKADVKRINGIAVHSFREVCKGPDAGDEYSHPPEETLLAHSRGGRREVDFQAATRAARGGRIEEFNATLTERRPKLFIRRSTFSGGGAVVGQFDFDDTTGSARVAPPEPFLGTAELDPAAAATWTGDLIVPFLGVGPVALAGPTFRARLHRSGGVIGPFTDSGGSDEPAMRQSATFPTGFNRR